MNFGTEGLGGDCGRVFICFFFKEKMFFEGDTSGMKFSDSVIIIINIKFCY